MKPTGQSRRNAFSLTEIVVTIAIMGVLAGIAVPMFGTTFDVSQRTVVVDHIEVMNRAVNKFSQNCWKIPTAPVADETTDEFLVLRSIQWTFPASELKLGSPYMDTRYSPASSSSTADFRIRWNGRTFELVDRGQAGTGLKFNGGEDYLKNPFPFPNGYKPVGP